MARNIAMEASAESKQNCGQRAYLSGLSAEEAVARHYQANGVLEAARRWRGHSGEIDLVVLDGEIVVFCEVKKARSFDAAMIRLGEAQMQRIYAAASEYLAQTPRGQLSEVRFDLALVDGAGMVQVMENAFGHF